MFVCKVVAQKTPNIFGRVHAVSNEVLAFPIDVTYFAFGIHTCLWLSCAEF